MNEDNIKALLAVWEPERGPLDDPQLEDALRTAEAALPKTVADERALNAQLRDSLAGLPAPEAPESFLATLRERQAQASAKVPPAEGSAAEAVSTLAPTQQQSWWRQTPVLSIAAVLIALLVAVALLRPDNTPPGPGVFTNATDVEVSERLAELITYLETLPRGDTPLRQADGLDDLVTLVRAQGGPLPAATSLPRNLDEDRFFACAVMDRDGIPVGMLCIKLEGGIHHVFTIEREHLPEQLDLHTPALHEGRDRGSASWTTSEHIHVLTGPKSHELVQML